MKPKLQQAIAIQRKYYTETAARYDHMHVHEGATNPDITNFVQAFFRMLAVRTVLDVGTATGLGMRDLKQAMPDLQICGIEPVAALVEQAVRDGNASSISMIRGTGEALPFCDDAFDVVCEFATLHHAANPDAVVEEMLRVARKAVLVCDSNRFGQGSMMARLVKLALYKCKLWKTYNYVRTRGKRYQITEGDGLAYSYSVYDSLDLITRWADRTILVPCGPGKTTSWFHPLLTSGAVLVCAIKERS